MEVLHVDHGQVLGLNLDSSGDALINSAAAAVPPLSNTFAKYSPDDIAPHVKTLENDQQFAMAPVQDIPHSSNISVNATSPETVDLGK